MKCDLHHIRVIRPAETRPKHALAKAIASDDHLSADAMANVTSGEKPVKRQQSVATGNALRSTK